MGLDPLDDLFPSENYVEFTKHTHILYNILTVVHMHIGYFFFRPLSITRYTFPTFISLTAFIHNLLLVAWIRRLFLLLLLPFLSSQQICRTFLSMARCVCWVDMTYVKSICSQCMFTTKIHKYMRFKIHAICLFVQFSSSSRVFLCLCVCVRLYVHHHSKPLNFFPLSCTHTLIQYNSTINNP